VTWQGGSNFTVDGMLELVLDVGTADGVVRSGRMVEIRTGRTTATRTLKIEGQPFPAALLVPGKL
jgi:hypothetical protein